MGTKFRPLQIQIQSNLGYPNSFVLRILYCFRISEFVQITEEVAKISRNRLVQEFITFQLLLNSLLVLDRSHSTRWQDKKQQNTATASLNFNTCCYNLGGIPIRIIEVSDNGGSDNRGLTVL